MVIFWRGFDVQAIDPAHRIVMENVRLHPVIPVHNRPAANALEVDGKLVRNPIPLRKWRRVRFKAVPGVASVLQTAHSWHLKSAQFSAVDGKGSPEARAARCCTPRRAGRSPRVNQNSTLFETGGFAATIGLTRC